MKRILIVSLLLILGFWPLMPAHAISIEKVTSPGGIVAWLVQDHSSPIISVNFAFRGGAAMDPDDKAGLAVMVAGLLDEGAGELDSQAFHEKLESLAISLGFSASEDALFGHLKTVSRHRDTAFDLLALSLSKPRFDAGAVERIRGQILAELSQQLQSPDAIAGRAFAKMLYPDHPYGRPTDGSPQSIQAISADDLRQWTSAHLGRDQLFVSVVGDMTPDDLAIRLDQVFAALPAQAAPITIAEVLVQQPGRIEVIRRQIPQSVALFGHNGIKRDDPDWYAAFVMNYILGGGGFSSRLLNEIRVKRGLAYSVYSYLHPFDHGSMISGGVASRNDRIAESLQLVRATWKQMAEKGVSATELSEAKTYLNGSFPLQLDSTGSIARLLLTLQMDHLGMDYLERRATLINAVTAADLQRVAKRLLDENQLMIVVVGDPAGL